MQSGSRDDLRSCGHLHGLCDYFTLVAKIVCGEHVVDRLAIEQEYFLFNAAACASNAA